MESYVIDISGAITSQFAALQNDITGGHGKGVIGKAVMDAVKQHFNNLDAERHHSFAPSPGFYAQAANGTHADIVPDGVEVVTDKTGLGLRIYGGTVYPGKNPSCVGGGMTKYLTVPAIAEAYGHRACDFGHLKFVKFGKGPDAPAALMEDAPKSATWSSTGKKVRNVMKQSKNKQGVWGRRIWFWLITSANHNADPTVLPDMGVLEDAAVNALEEMTARFNL